MKDFNAIWLKKAFILLIDLCIVLAAFSISLLIIFDLVYHPRYQLELIVILLTYSVFFRIFHTYFLVVKYLGEKDYLNSVFASIGAVGTLLLIETISEAFFLHYKIIVLISLLSLYGMILFRWFMKTFHPYFRKYRTEKKRTAVFGAKKMGQVVLDLALRQRESMKVVAFFDEDPKLATRWSNNVKIYNPDQHFESVLQQKKVEQIIFASEDLSEQKKKYYVDKCLAKHIKVLTVPSYKKWIDGKLSANQLENIQFEELLNRQEIFLDKEKIRHTIRDKTILVTGAAGSIGSEIVRQLARFNPARLILLDNAESPLVNLTLEIEEVIQFKNSIEVIADITEIVNAKRIFMHHKPDIVYHAAAYKHVPILEKHAYEAARINVLGTKVMAELACDYNVEKFILISTDKAINPSSVMGTSKRIAELIVQCMNHHCENTNFMITRFGNVLGSSGSVVPRFKKQISDGGPVTVTHPEVERYFMTIPEACQLVLEASAIGTGGEVFLFDMGEPIRIADLAESMIRLAGFEPGKDIEIVYTGLRPGEKLKEELVNQYENSESTYHPKILISQKPRFNFRQIDRSISSMINKLSDLTDEEIYTRMQQILPVFSEPELNHKGSTQSRNIKSQNKAESKTSPA